MCAYTYVPFYIVISLANTSLAGPVATIQGLEPRRVLSPPLPPRPPHVTIPSSSSLSPVPPTPPPKFDLKGLPPLTEQDRIKFMQIFHKSGPENGFLSGMYYVTAHLALAVH